MIDGNRVSGLAVLTPYLFSAFLRELGFRVTFAHDWREHFLNSVRTESGRTRAQGTGGAE